MRPYGIDIIHIDIGDGCGNRVQGFSAYHCEPSRPDSSAVTARKTMLRSAGAVVSANRPGPVSAAVPVALSERH